MDDEILRRRLREKIKNPRVRRMLNLDNINVEKDSTGSRPELNEEDCSTGLTSQDNSKQSDGDELFTKTTMKRLRRDSMQQYEDNVFEELEEPFSPVVSEYNPTTDSSDSDESIELNTRKRNRPSRKMGLLGSICQTATEIENEWEQNEGDLSKSSAVADNMKQSSINSVQVSDKIVTPTLSPFSFYKKISTPDSFKDVLQLVQNSSKTNENMNNSIGNVNPQPLLLYKQQLFPINKINKNMLPNPDLNYEKFRFVASTSIVYLEGNLNTNYLGRESIDLISPEIMDPAPIENNVSDSYNNDLTQSSSSMLTERESRIKPAFIATQSTIYINDENVEPTIAEKTRNRFVFALYVHASVKLNLKITHRFLQKGHTQNEGDSMHSCIERSKKNHVLYVPEEIYAIIRNAKVQGQRYNVKEMTQEDFFDFKKLITNNTNWAKDMSGEKINWTKIKEISVDPLSPRRLMIRYDFDDETPIILDTNRCIRVGRKKKTPGSENIGGLSVLSQLYDAPLPISENLYKDLMSLCRDNHIPPHYQTFYKNLRPQSTSNENNFDVVTDSDSS